MTDVGSTCSKCSLEKNQADTISRRKSPRVQKTGTSPKHSSPTEIKTSKSKKTSQTDQCEFHRDISLLKEELTRRENHRNKREVTGNITTRDVLTPQPVLERVNMPCSAVTRSIVQDLSLRTRGMVSKDIWNESVFSTTQFDDSDDCETDTSYRSCSPAVEPYVETIGDQCHESDGIQIAKLKLRQEIEAHLTECEEIETKLSRTDGVRDDTKTMQCDVLRSARDSTLTQLHIISSLEDDLEIQMMKQQLQMLKRVLSQSQSLVNERIRSRNFFDTMSSGIANFINCNSDSGDTMGQHWLNIMLFCIVIAILFYVHQF